MAGCETKGKKMLTEGQSPNGSNRLSGSFSSLFLKVDLVYMEMVYVSVLWSYIVLGD